jgi:hypothetical protein
MLMDSVLRPEGSGSLESNRRTGLSPLISIFGDDDGHADSMPDARRVSYTVFVFDGTSPVGIAMAQDLHIYLHVFHHFTPPAGWTFGQDGAPSVPPPP